VRITGAGGAIDEMAIDLSAEPVAG
jgi:hypothetical protein